VAAAELGGDLVAFDLEAEAFEEGGGEFGVAGAVAGGVVGGFADQGGEEVGLLLFAGGEMGAQGFAVGGHWGSSGFRRVVALAEGEVNVPEAGVGGREASKKKIQHRGTETGRSKAREKEGRSM
jgi:hypothetical protein